ncbi:cytochrome P450 [Exidia glandulosa HHB12029]|uniref:Cytochrome P450 n=1 Tax=Exidia glandulosa HHB12029 TaxID=1314781 RepID=A0A165KG57_EXIGL|nr:cytochrome P450 [Exidia glandulosa HHB12029]
MVSTTAILILCALGAIVAQRVLEMRKLLKRVGDYPGWRFLISPIIPIPMPKVKWINPGWMWQMKEGYKPLAEHGQDVITMASLFPTEVSYYVADPVTIKEIFLSSQRFPKPLKFYDLINIFGPNVVGSDGATWKKHRKPSAPAFSERNNKLVWDESLKVILSLFETEAWRDKEEITIDHALDVTLPMALFVIGIAGFGRQINWSEDVRIPTGHTLSFKDALHIVSSNLRIKLLTPSWLMPWRAHWRLIDEAHKELRSYMTEMIVSRRTALVKEERYDLFSGLLDATELDNDDQRLTNDELLGNVFIFLLAGHETTAHTLAFALGLLAIFKDEQEKLYQSINSVIPNGRIPEYEEFGKLNQALAVIYETLRFYPPATGVGKISAEDTTLPTSEKGGNGSIFVPAGSLVAVGFTALHMNPKYWPEPEKFIPGRFLKDDWPRDAFYPFSGGVRSCLGRKFFESEAVALLSMIISRYKVEIKDDPAWAGITDLQLKREKVLAQTMSLTMAPKRVPLVFKRR